jgi:putative transposase
MIDRAHDLPITKQAEALNISRGSVYYLPRPVSAADLALMRRIDELHLEFPFAGSRMLRGLLAAEGSKVGRRHVKTLMQRMGIEALYRGPRTTKPEPGHKIYPYLLRGKEITRPNQVWAMDITYIRMARGFVYLAVVLDWFSRRVLSWRVSITMEAAFCIETLEEALAKHGKPAIFNTDQGSQFTGAASTGVLANKGIAISMDGKGRGATTSSSNDSGEASNTRRCISRPMTACPRPARRSAVISTSTIAAGRTRALTASPWIKPTSTRCRSARRPDLGRSSTYRRGNSVQTNGTTSFCPSNSHGRSSMLKIVATQLRGTHHQSCSACPAVRWVSLDGGLGDAERAIRIAGFPFLSPSQLD